MIKIFLTVRNRLSTTKHFITALKNHSKFPHRIYIYDNLTNHRLKEHFDYWHELYKKGEISQVTFTSEDSTFRTFSKAATCNFFGLQHEQDPSKNQYSFLLFLDNDIILTPNFDEILKNAWEDVNKLGLKNIKVIGQLPGGINNRVKLNHKIAGFKAEEGIQGGSALWSVRPDFFRDVGILNLEPLIGINKKHDQSYWELLYKSTGGKRYILGLDHKLGVHMGHISGSICNKIGFDNDKKLLEKIKFEEQEDTIDKMSFEEFYNMVLNDTWALDDW